MPPTTKAWAGQLRTLDAAEPTPPGMKTGLIEMLMQPARECPDSLSARKSGLLKHGPSGCPKTLVDGSLWRMMWPQKRAQSGWLDPDRFSPAASTLPSDSLMPAPTARSETRATWTAQPASLTTPSGCRAWS